LDQHTEQKIGLGMNRKFTAIIERENDGYVALCPELDVASQGDTVDNARKNLQEALELFFETASPEELRTGTLRSIIRQPGLPRSDFE
jgi:predicted RNase H-like HicB family nuclease